MCRDCEQDNAKMQASTTLGMAERIGPSNDEIVRHHSPHPGQIQRITAIRQAALNFMNIIDTNCPQSADRADAKRKVREAMMTANASIVLDGMV